MQNHSKYPSLIAELSPEACKTSKKGIMDFEDADTTGGDEDLPPPTTTEGEDQILRSICSLLEEEDDQVAGVNPQTLWLMASC